MKDKWKELIRKYLSKKYVANLVVLVVIAIMFLVMFGNNSSTDSTSLEKLEKSTQEFSLADTYENRSKEEIMERRLKGILEKMQGVGEVEVMITFEMGAEIVPALNTIESRDTTEEEDANGGIRKVTSYDVTENLVMTNDSRGNQAIVLKKINPQIKGVIVVATGAKDIRIKARLYEAVKTVLQVPTHRVQVYAKE
ncbi:MAG: stage III sporulation protein AG [Alkaliphilus sp.]|nr:stage III sporulation protein AG [Alkaliphilus sp. AH-315-G20]PHS36514.1 MAG: stage III sporulation protein AG [Alkaliphilus sp.]